jgi:hypothetical protein
MPWLYLIGLALVLWGACGGVIAIGRRMWSIDTTLGLNLVAPLRRAERLERKGQPLERPATARFALTGDPKRPPRGSLAILTPSPMMSPS